MHPSDSLAPIEPTSAEFLPHATPLRGGENLHPSLAVGRTVLPESSSVASDRPVSVEPMLRPPIAATTDPYLSSGLERPMLGSSSGSSPFPLPSGGPNLSSHSSSSFDSSAAQQVPSQQHPSQSQQQQQQRKKSKLPHGLTVQELKEMTKARLQAEAAAEQKSLVSAPPTPVGGGGSIGIGGCGSNSIGGGFRDDGVSPLPPFSAQPQPPSLRPRPHSQARGGCDASWSYDSRSDAWETGSVSTVASEYLGSESAYGLGSFGPEEPSPGPYGRPPMMGGGVGGGGPIHNFSDAPPMEGVLFPGASPGFYPHHLDGGLGGAPPLQQRRRAATLSPRQGLSFLDERHEVYPDHDTMPTLPSFGSPAALHYPSRSRHNYTTADRFHPASSGLRAPIGGSSSLDFNRPRTSSAASLPPMSHTADEFDEGIDLAPPVRRVPSGLGSFRDQAPSPTVTGLADSFHPDGANGCSFLGRSSSHSMPPPPGLGGLAPPSSTLVDPYSSSGMSTPDLDLRARASTWGGTSSLDSVFGPGLFGGPVHEPTPPHQQHTNQLCDDLASLLKLSVPEHLPPPQQQQQPPLPPMSLLPFESHPSRGDNQLFPPPPGL